MDRHASAAAGLTGCKPFTIVKMISLDTPGRLRLYLFLQE
jgi:hypothetical protein